MNKNNYFIPMIILTVLFFNGCQLKENEAIVINKISEPEKEKTDDQLISYIPNTCLDIKNTDNIENARPSFKGNFFSINYPFNFTASKENPNSDYGFFQSPDKKVIFAVYSPQWTGQPDKIMIQSGESLVAEKRENITLECETEVGPGGAQKIQRLIIKANDNSYKRSIIDIRLVAPEDSSETRKTFSIQYDNDESFKRYGDDFEKFMRSLTQYAD